RRIGHAVGQRITAADTARTPSRQGSALGGDLHFRLGHRVRAGVDARGIEGSERRRALVEIALTLGGVLHDLLLDLRPRLADRLDALDLVLVAALVRAADDELRVAAHGAVDDGLDRGLRALAVVVGQDGVSAEALRRNEPCRLCVRVVVLAILVEQRVADVVGGGGVHRQLVLTLVTLVVQLEARLRYAAEALRDRVPAGKRRFRVGTYRP